jgi:hypothetical protein
LNTPVEKFLRIASRGIAEFGRLMGLAISVSVRVTCKEIHVMFVTRQWKVQACVKFWLFVKNVAACDKYILNVKI